MRVGVCVCSGSFAIMQVSGTAAVLPAQGNQGYCMGFQPYLPVLNCSSGRILVNNWGPLDACCLNSDDQRLMAMHTISRQRTPDPGLLQRVSLLLRLQCKIRLSPPSGAFVCGRPTDRQWLLSHQDKSQGAQNRAGRAGRAANTVQRRPCVRMCVQGY